MTMGLITSMEWPVIAVMMLTIGVLGVVKITHIHTFSLLYLFFVIIHLTFVIIFQVRFVEWLPPAAPIIHS